MNKNDAVQALATIKEFFNQLYFHPEIRAFDSEEEFKEACDDIDGVVCYLAGNRMNYEDILKSSILWDVGVQEREFKEIAKAAKPLVNLLRMNRLDGVCIIITSKGVDVKYAETLHMNI